MALSFGSELLYRITVSVKAILAQGFKLEDSAYRAKFFPFAPWFAFILCAIVVLGQNYQAVLGGEIAWLF